MCGCGWVGRSGRGREEGEGGKGRGRERREGEKRKRGRGRERRERTREREREWEVVRTACVLCACVYIYTHPGRRPFLPDSLRVVRARARACVCIYIYIISADMASIMRTCLDASMHSCARAHTHTHTHTSPSSHRSRGLTDPLNAAEAFKAQTQGARPCRLVAQAGSRLGVTRSDSE